MANKLRILYAEDDPLGALLTQKILEQIDFIVETVPDGAKAWEAYKKQKPDILLLDLNIPNIDGLKITGLVRKQDPLTHITIYTAHGEPAKEVAVLEAGADEFFSKDKGPEILAAHFKRLREKIVKKHKIPYIYQLSPDTTYNGVTRILIIRNEKRQLPYIDGRFLQLLCVKNHEVADKQFLIRGIWDKADTAKESELKKYASRVRSYLKADATLRIECRDNGYILFTTKE